MPKCLPVLPLALCLALPALAQERWSAALTWDANAISSYHATESLGGTVVQRLDITPDANTGLGLQLGYRAWELPAKAEISLTGGYRFKASSRAAAVSSGLDSSTGEGRLRLQSYSLGAELTWHLAVDLGGGLLVRAAKFSGDTPTLSGSVSTFRPWITSHVGYTFKPATAFKPFVAFRLGFGLGSSRVPLESELDQPGGPEKWLKAFDPTAEAMLLAGVRF